MAKLQVNYKTGGGNVVVKFFSGVLISQWVGLLTLPGGVKRKFEGKNTDPIPDQVVFAPAQLPTGAELDWWVVVFAPAGPEVDYKVTVTVEQDGRKLCDPIVKSGKLGGHKATVESGEIVFTAVA